MFNIEVLEYILSEPVYGYFIYNKVYIIFIDRCLDVYLSI